MLWKVDRTRSKESLRSCQYYIIFFNIIAGDNQLRSPKRCTIIFASYLWFVCDLVSIVDAGSRGSRNSRAIITWRGANRPVSIKQFYNIGSCFPFRHGPVLNRPSFVFQDYSSHRNSFPLFWATRVTNYRSDDMHRQVGSIAMITQILTFDFLSKETHIFQS